MKKLWEWVLKAVIPLMVLSLLGWATWITSSIYAGDKGGAVREEKIEALGERIGRIEGEMKDIKEGQREIQKDMKAADEKGNRNQIEMIKMLMDIKNNTKQ